MSGPAVAATRVGAPAQRPWIALAVGLLALALATVYLLLPILDGTSRPSFAVSAVRSAAYAIAGMAVWWRRPQYPTGPLMVAAAYLALAGTLQRFTSSAPLYAMGSAFGGLEEGILAYLVLTFPSGRPSATPLGWLARLLLVLPIFLGIADLLTRPMSDVCDNIYGFCAQHRNPFTVVDLGRAVPSVQAVAEPALAAIVVVGVTWRFAAAHGAARRSLAPVLVAGLLAAVAVAVSSLATLSGDKDAWLTISRAAEALIPVALGVGFIRSRMARGGVAGLLLKAGSHPTPTELQEAVRATLHDPTALLLRWSDTAGTYLNADGEPIEAVASDRRQVSRITDANRLLGAIEHDPVLAEEGDLVQSVVAAARIVLDNELLASSLQAQVSDAARLPRGVVTLMRTDIEGSTELLARLREDYAALLLELRRLLRTATSQGGGVEVDSRADEFFAAFPDAVRAVRTAMEIQRQVRARSWPDEARVRIRIGLHTGEPSITAEGYVGLDIHLAARVSATGSGGQIVISDATQDAVHDAVGDPAIHDLGMYRLKGIPRPVRLFEVDVPGSSEDHPPLHAQPAEEPTPG